ncbi:hypothetical protein BJ138DRAFT_1152005 [Hygrophoropsis aurantiaca]|uniref:Uncharacterized protein n=1 Tax=Hygrophoropsis aurantiaca TaxID=72124 RepID=A0ACB8AC43_9AGAM|nr:hypothetical protein BJ138DRAFT_1152005 [Hygrophoropsis aurantiaca]
MLELAKSEPAPQPPSTPNMGESSEPILSQIIERVPTRKERQRANRRKGYAHFLDNAQTDTATASPEPPQLSTRSETPDHSAVTTMTASLEPTSPLISAISPCLPPSAVIASAHLALPSPANDNRALSEPPDEPLIPVVLPRHQSPPVVASPLLPSTLSEYEPRASGHLPDELDRRIALLEAHAIAWENIQKRSSGNATISTSRHGAKHHPL